MPAPATLLEQLEALRASRFPGYDVALARVRAADLAVDRARAEQADARQALFTGYGDRASGLDFAIAEVRQAVAAVAVQLTDAEVAGLLETVK